MSETLLQTFELRREYGDTVAVQDVSLSVPRGAVVALVGPNGAGKTTLLKMLAALLEPTRGTAQVCGLDIREHPREVHSHVGFLPDFYGLYDELRVREYLEYFGRAYRLGPERREEVIDEVLSEVALVEKKDSLIETLSRGMRQRLAIARTLIHDPLVLLLDEPAAGLDPEGRHELQLLFRRLAQSGKTLIVSSHILSELEDYCSHIAILHKGVLMASGVAEEVRQSLGKDRQIRIRTNGNTQELEAILRATDPVQRFSQEEDGWLVSFSGDEEAMADLLKQLVASGVPVTFFGEERRTIQDTYLALLRPNRP